MIHDRHYYYYYYYYYYYHHHHYYYYYYFYYLPDDSISWFEFSSRIQVPQCLSYLVVGSTRRGRESLGTPVQGFSLSRVQEEGFIAGGDGVGVVTTTVLGGGGRRREEREGGGGGFQEW